MAGLKLRRLRVSGFKSLVDFELEFRGPIKVLVGPNGVGKSTILQPFDFKVSVRTSVEDHRSDSHTIRSGVTAMTAPERCSSDVDS